MSTRTNSPLHLYTRIVLKRVNTCFNIGINYDCFITQLTVILMLYITNTNFFILHYSNKTRNATFENLPESVSSGGSLHTE